MARGFHPVRRSSDPVPSTSSERNNNAARESNMNSLRARLALPINQMAIPIYTAMTEEQVVASGQLLFHDFVHQEFEEEGLADDVLLTEPPPDAAGDVGPSEIYQSPVFLNHASSSNSMASTPEGYTAPSLVHVGANIRELANQFANSKERQTIKRQADAVDLSHITSATFIGMLEEIFINGLNKHCIVALFFFCSDILKRCVRVKLNELGSLLFWWSMKYIANRVCEWVYQHGGWERVFSNLYNVVFKISAIVALGVVISCGFIYLRKNL